ncbi:MAG TPA: hypothetical protein EYQ14_05855 [Gammaproteobacteria bacterium]|nr:hypothetical protein [Gammaproteobacteria bacterium]
MNMLKKVLFVSFLFSFSIPVMAEATTLTEAITGGDAHLNFRYRLEQVDQKDFSKDALASTLRTRLNYKTDSLNGFKLFIEFDDVTYLGNDKFNSSRNGQTSYPVIADPDGTDINQVLIEYTGHDTSLYLGRQRLNLDNQRFIGGVAWRQNEQTYDAFTIQNSTIRNTTLKYNYVSKVQRIFGPDDGSPQKEFDSDTHLLNAKINFDTLGSVVLYGYLMDLESAPTSSCVPGNCASNRTLGFRYTNNFDFASFKVPLNIEYARQDDYADNPLSYRADYILGEVGLTFDKFRILLGNEILKGDDKAGTGFQTPLATLHKFQGWADKFLSTPATGIDDRYLTIGTNWKKAAFMLTFHDLSSDTTSSNYGTEWNASVNFKINKNYSLLFKYASYDADELFTDTKKGWIMFTAKF